MWSSYYDEDVSDPYDRKLEATMSAKVSQYTYKCHCRKTYASRSDATDALRRLGPPPSFPDISHPTATLEVPTALEILTHLYNELGYGRPEHTKTQVSMHIKRNWVLISPWVRFFLEHFAVVDFNDYPTTEEGQVYIEIAIDVLAGLLRFVNHCPGSTRHHENRRIGRMTPWVTPLLARLWLKLQNPGHRKWWETAVLMENFIMSDKHGIGIAFGHCLEDIYDQTGGTTDMVKISIMRIRKWGAYAYHQTLNGPYWGGFRALFVPLWISFHQIDTVYLRSLCQGGAGFMVHVFHAMASRPRTLSAFQETSIEFQAALGIVEICMNFIESSMSGPRWVAEVLDAGLIRAMFKALSNISEAYDRARAEDAQKKRMCYILMQVLKRIEHHLVYPSILQRFVSATKTVDETGLSQALNPKPEYFWPVWEQAKAKAKELRTLFVRYRAEKVFFCDNEMCPLKDTDYKRSTKPRYLRCSACTSAMYCSHRCGRQDWKRHRQTCLRIAPLWKGGRPIPPSKMEIGFFQVVIRNHATNHAEEIRKELASVRISENDIRERPVVMYNMGSFEQPDLTFKIESYRNVISDTRLSVEDIAALESSDSLDPVMVCAFYPAGRCAHTAAWTTVMSIPNP